MHMGPNGPLDDTFLLGLAASMRAQPEHAALPKATELLRACDSSESLCDADMPPQPTPTKEAALLPGPPSLNAALDRASPVLAGSSTKSLHRAHSQA